MTSTGQIFSTTVIDQVFEKVYETALTIKDNNFIETDENVSVYVLSQRCSFICLRNLSQMIEEVNRLSTPAMSSQPSGDGQLPDDPINQLSAILGAHLRRSGRGVRGCQEPGGTG